jgi:hypothetical protein
MQILGWLRIQQRLVRFSKEYIYNYGLLPGEIVIRILQNANAVKPPCRHQSFHSGFQFLYFFDRCPGPPTPYVAAKVRAQTEGDHPDHAVLVAVVNTRKGGADGRVDREVRERGIEEQIHALEPARAGNEQADREAGPEDGRVQ